MSEFIEKNKRRIHKELYDLIDKNLNQHSFSMYTRLDMGKAIDEVCQAIDKIQIKEEGGNNKGKLVAMIQSVIGPITINGNGEAWCMSLVQTIIVFIEIKTNILSQLYPSEGCVDCFNRSKDLSVNLPKVGDIFIWKNPNSNSGHTGIIRAINLQNGTMKTFEGNTSDGNDRDGDGVYIRMRQTGGTKSLKHYGFLRPF